MFRIQKISPLKSKHTSFKSETYMNCFQKYTLFFPIDRLSIRSSHTFDDTIGIDNPQFSGFTQIGYTPIGIPQR